MAENISSYILDYAAGKTSFTLEEVYEAYSRTEPLERSTLTWHLGKLATQRKIARVGQGVYTLADKAVFAPALSEHAKTVYASLSKTFPGARLCLYEGPWISPMLHNLASNQIIYVETDRMAAEAVFEQLRVEGRSAYFRPDEDMIYRYIDLDKPALFVKPLVSEAPVTKRDGIPVATLEKLLVDIYTDPDFYYLQGGEYHSIVENARTLYSINTVKLLRYASRRGVKEDMVKFFEEQL